MDNCFNLFHLKIPYQNDYNEAIANAITTAIHAVPKLKSLKEFAADPATGVVLGEIGVLVGGTLGTVGAEEFDPEVPFETPVGEDMNVEVVFEKPPIMAVVGVGDGSVVAASRLDADDIEDVVKLLPDTGDAKLSPVTLERRAARKKKVR